MGRRVIVPVLALFLLGGCRHHHSFSGEAVAKEVRGFMLGVAADITRDGPTAWGREFANTPAFFMAVDGHLVFADGASAAVGIQKLPAMIKTIELKWGDDLRVDVLTREFAVVGSSYHERRVDPAGVVTEENGYFTAVVEYRGGRWEIRDAHWSVAGATP
jgi:hypothetical protein